MEVAEPPVKIQFGLTQFLYSRTFVNNRERNSMAQTRRQYAFEKRTISLLHSVFEKSPLTIATLRIKKQKAGNDGENT